MFRLALFSVWLIVFLNGAPADSHDRGCIYINGHCYKDCPEETHSYTPSCFENSKSERTCNNPVSREEPPICDLSRCDCDEPKVKDQTSGKCVEIKDCPGGYY